MLSHKWGIHHIDYWDDSLLTFNRSRNAILNGLKLVTKQNREAGSKLQIERMQIKLDWNILVIEDIVQTLMRQLLSTHRDFVWILFEL